MRKLITYLSIISLLVACASQKSTQQNQPSTVIVNTNCDSLIQSALFKIKSDSVTPCEDLQVEIIRLSQALSDCKKNESECTIALSLKPTTVIDKSRTKYRNSFNDITKNSNNTTEVNNLKRSIQVKSDSIAYLQANNLALNSKVKDLTKIKKSTTGDNSPNTNKSGNTTNKASWYLWLITFCVGGLSSQAIRMIITKSI